MLHFSYSGYVRGWTIRVSNLGTGKKFFASLKYSDGLGAHIHPPVPWVPRFLPRVKQSGREVNSSPLSNTKIKNGWNYISNAPYAFKSWLGKTFNIFTC